MSAREPRIELFGGLRLLVGNRIVNRFETQKTAALLAYLAYHPGRPHNREFLADLLWQDDSPAARHRLRMALSALRPLLGDSLAADRVAVWLDRDLIRTDVAEFESGVRAAVEARSEQARLDSLMGAVDLYRGELLPGFYADWVLGERRRLEEACIGALRRLVRLLTAGRNLEKAIEFARKAVALDPLREEAHRDLMRLMAATGQPSAALKQYRDLEETLINDLQNSPAPSTIALARQIAEASGKGRRPIENLGDAAAVVAAGTSQDVVAARLPSNSAAFFGRQDEIRALIDLLTARPPEKGDRGIVVTLVGPGGCGKTRLAIETVGRLAPRFEGDIWFVSLQDENDPGRIIHAIASALHVALSPGTAPIRQLAAALGGRRPLIILDNFEQLMNAGAIVVEALLTEVPVISLLVTSRHRLGITGEHEVAVGPLSTFHAKETLSEIADSMAARLFVDRARHVCPRFALAEDNADAVARICSLVDSMPLPIELAASRARVMTPAEIERHLSNSLDVLESRDASIPDRQRSLRASVDWSFDLLEPEVRDLTAALSVFHGGFTADAAVAVCLAEGELENGETPWNAETLRCLSMLEELCDSSMLNCESTGELSRFRMHETIRQYAEQRLGDERSPVLRERHAYHFRTALRRFRGPSALRTEPGLLEFLERERANLLAALEWAEQNNHAAALELAVGMERHWWLRGELKEGRERIANLATNVCPQGPTHDLFRALRAAGRMALIQGDLSGAERLYREGREFACQLEDARGIAELDLGLGVVAYWRGDADSARSRFEGSLETFRGLGDQAGIAACTNSLGLLSFDADDFDGARDLFEESAANWRALDDPDCATTLSNLGMLAMAQKRYADARAHYEEHMAIRTREKNRMAVARGWHNLGRVAHAEGDTRLAATNFSRALRAYRESGSWSFAVDALECMALVFIDQEEFARAARLLGACDSMRRQLNQPRPAMESQSYSNALQRLESSLGAPALEREMRAGGFMTAAQAVDAALRS